MSASAYAKINAAQLAAWRAQTEEHIRKIRSSPNTIPTDIPVYYVSDHGNDGNDGRTPETAWATLARASEVTGNAAVCFARGGLFRGQLQAKPGVTYTAYGEGAKPILYGSPENGADPEKWTQTADDPTVWVYKTIFSEDVGCLIFDEGAYHAVKTVLRAADADAVVTDTAHSGNCIDMTHNTPFADYHDLANDLDFWHDDADRRVYLKSAENPGTRFSSIEFNVRHNVIAVGGSNGVTIDNLCVKYGGCHGVGAGTVKDLTVKNCEFGWIGGAIQYIRNGRTVRFGNAVEIYGGCENYSVTDCYIYQIYDAGITQQYTLTEAQAASGAVCDQKNVTYARNVIEHCNYSIEYFLGHVPEDNPTHIENFVIEDNDAWYAADGLCEQRPDHRQGAHIKGWDHDNRARNYRIRNNRFVLSKDIMLHIHSSLYNPDGSESMPVLENNCFVNHDGGRLGVCSQQSNTWVPYDRDVIAYLGDKTQGDTFYFAEAEQQ